MTIPVNMTLTVALGVLVYIFGQKIVDRVEFLQKYCIPAPVVGGLIFSVIHLIGVQTGTFAFEFDQTLKDFFMIGFFATIGFSASLRIIKQGGIAIVILFIVSSIMLIIQNVWGVAIARAFDLHPLIGMCAGSISLMGGVGSSAAFAPIMESNGATGGLTVAIASATFGLVMGGLVAGPVARFLIDRYKLVEKAAVTNTGNEIDYSELEIEDDEPEIIKTKDLSTGFFILMLAMGIGSIISMLINATGLVFPAYVGAIFAAAFIRNIADSRNKELPHKEISAIGNIFLNIFLAMTIMSLEIWEIAGMALPLIVILIGQVILLIIFAILVVYTTTGRDYDAAVMSAGFYGYAMGATPNAMASMNAVVERYGRPSPKAFFTVPIVGGFLMDFSMAILIIGHMNLILKGIL